MKKVNQRWRAEKQVLVAVPAIGHGSLQHWTQNPYWRAESKRQKKVVTTLHQISHHSLKWCGYVSYLLQINKDFTRRTERVLCCEAASQATLTLRQHELWEPGGNSSRCTQLLVKPRQRVYWHATGSPGRLVHHHLSTFNFYTCKAERQKMSSDCIFL